MLLTAARFFGPQLLMTGLVADKLTVRRGWPLLLPASSTRNGASTVGPDAACRSSMHMVSLLPVKPLFDTLASWTLHHPVRGCFISLA